MKFWYRVSRGTILRNYFEFGPVFQEELRLKDISYLELWRPLGSGERNHLCNFGRRHHEKQFSEIILNLDKWFRRRICAILVEGIMRNNSVKLF